MLNSIILVWLCLFISTIKAVLDTYTPALDLKAAWYERDSLVAAYFKQSYSNAEILLFLSTVHGIMLSLSQLKRILRRLSLRRHIPQTPQLLQSTLDEIENELQGSGQCLGYKSMWRRLRRKGIYVQRNIVRQALLLLDPKGVALRRRKRLKRRIYINLGPNFVWHIDGYDKLKPYGFAIHGAIDGYSRRILWLEVGPSNNNPNVIAKYYLETVLQLKTLPIIVRCDKGTENIHIAKIQPFLRSDHDDMFSGNDSFLYGKSTGNQRIESWWCILRRQSANFWMNLFKDMISIGLFKPDDPIHANCLRYCFMHLISYDLTKLAVEWNQHLIEAKQKDEGPRGKPDVLFFTPQRYNTESYGHMYNKDHTMSILHEIEQNNLPPDYNPTFVELVLALLPDVEEPKTVDEALSLYTTILQSIDNIEH